MIDFIVKLEEILKNSGNEDWGIKYVPEKDGYRKRYSGIQSVGAIPALSLFLFAKKTAPIMEGVDIYEDDICCTRDFFRMLR